MHGPPGPFPRRELWPESRDALRGRDPVLDRCMDAVAGAPKVRIIEDPFLALASGFCHLVVNARQGEKNFNRLLELNGDKLPTASDILEIDSAKLYECIAVNKHAEYLKDIAFELCEAPGQLEDLDALDDGQVVKKLRAFKGVGPWLAGWVLMYHLGRPQVLLENDASLLRAVRRMYDLPRTPSPNDLRNMASKWGDHVSAACWYIFMAAEANEAT